MIAPTKFASEFESDPVLILDSLRRKFSLAPSAQNVVQAILAEYTFPEPRGAWQGTLVEAMRAIGLSPATTRQAISRARREGELTTTRIGRQSFVRLTDMRIEMLRLYQSAISSSLESLDWDGRWLVILVRPTERGVRYEHATQAVLVGLGYLGNSVWITPYSRLFPQLESILEAQPGVEVMSFWTELGDKEIRKVIERGWSLTKARDEYERVISKYDVDVPSAPEAQFAAWTSLLLDLPRALFLDPHLPNDVLGDDWPRERARELYFRARRELRPGAHEWFAAQSPPNQGDMTRKI